MRVVDAEREHRKKVKRKFYKTYGRMRHLLKDLLKRELAARATTWRAETIVAPMNIHRVNAELVVSVRLSPNKYKPNHAKALNGGMTFSEPLATFPNTIATQLMLIAP